MPKIFAEEILRYARQLDAGEAIKSVSQPEEDLDQAESNLIEDTSRIQIPLFDLSEVQPISIDYANNDSVIESVTQSKLTPLRGNELARRFGVDKGAPSSRKSFWRNDPQKFLEWTRNKDPEGYAWEFNPRDKLYYPITDIGEDF